MKLKVRIDNETFDVRVGKTNIYPIIVDVNGEIFEVWPEISNPEDPLKPQNDVNNNLSSEIQKNHSQALVYHPQSLKPGASEAEQKLPPRSGTIRAPIPGVITAVNAQVGSHVSVGDELFKLEAMKMNNSIRSIRAGVVKSIHVSVGQIVRLNEELLEFCI